MAPSPTDEGDGVGRGRHDLCHQQHEDGQREQDGDACKAGQGDKRECPRATRAIFIFMLAWLFFSLMLDGTLRGAELPRGAPVRAGSRAVPESLPSR